jgi:hypothetical protein
MNCMQHEDRVAHNDRGRCYSCYKKIMRMIRDGKLTEQSAVKLRYFLPRKAKKTCKNA